MFDGENGWAIASAEARSTTSTGATRSRPTACSTCSSARSCPLFYEPRRGPGAPRAGSARVKHVAGHARAACRGQPHGARLRRPSSTSPPAAAPTALGGRRLAPGPRPGGVEAAGARRRGTASGSTRVDDRRRRSPSSAPSGTVTAVGRRSATLAPDDVEVQLLHGPVGPDDELVDPTVADGPRRRAAPSDGTRPLRRARSRCDRAGRYGFTVRVVPAHPDLASPAELGRIAWA